MTTDTGKKREGTLAEFFARSPLRGSKIKIERLKGGPRRIDLSLRGKKRGKP